MRWIVTILLLLPLAARAASVTIPGPDGVALRAELFLPAGPARGPAVVALHGCGGAFPSRDRQWTRVLTKAGHAVVFPDSFGSRGLGPQCGSAARAVTAEGLRRQDALAAARWLAAQPFAPPGGVALLGWSNGAITALNAAAAGPEVPPGLLRAVVAFYPGCRLLLRRQDWRPAAPVLILMGAADDWTPAGPCRAFAARFPDRVRFVAYPGAYHDFDAPHAAIRLHRGLAFSAAGNGVAHAGTDPAARRDALARVVPFLEGTAPAR